jgi:hypothetical protein
MPTPTPGHHVTPVPPFHQHHMSRAHVTSGAFVTSIPVTVRLIGFNKINKINKIYALEYILFMVVGPPSQASIGLIGLNI